MATTSLTSVGSQADSWSRGHRSLIDTRIPPRYTRADAGLCVVVAGRPRA